MAKESGDEKYTDPELREQMREEVKAPETRAAGQGSGRLASRNSSTRSTRDKAAATNKGERNESQKHFKMWADEEWQTEEGEAKARDGDEIAHYLPKKAWENMSNEEKRATGQRKREGSRKREQYVPNTEEAKEARKGSPVSLIEGATTT